MAGNIFNPEQVDTKKEFTLGDEMTDHLGETFIYCEADANVAVGNAVRIANDFGVQGTTTTLVGTGSRKLGIVKTAIPSGQLRMDLREGQWHCRRRD